MKTFIIQATLETEHAVFRNIQIPNTASLKALHLIILEAFQFSGKQMASFIKEGDGWTANAEYPLESLGENDKTLMHEITLEQIFSLPGETITYLYDYLNEWRFQIKLTHVDNALESQEVKIIHSIGKAPNEAERNFNGSDAESILMDAILGEDFHFEMEESGFDADSFDSLDDYVEYH